MDGEEKLTQSDGRPSKEEANRSRLLLAYNMQAPSRERVEEHSYSDDSIIFLFSLSWFLFSFELQPHSVAEPTGVSETKRKI
jgi:hypothetical protein